MNFLRRTFIHNTILGLLIALLISLFVCQSLSQTKLKAEESHSQLIVELFSSDLSQNSKELIKALKSTNTYRLLKVQTATGAILHQYTTQTPESYLSQNLMSWLGLKTAPQPLSSSDKQFTITYELAFTHEYAQADKLLMLIWGGLLMSVIAFSFIALANFKKLIQKTADQLGEQFHLERSEKTDHSGNQISKECQPLYETLNQQYQKLSQQIDKWKSSAESLKHESELDELTGLANRRSFLDHFNQLLKSERANKFGCLAIVRATELQAINQSRGFEAGDEYISTLTQAIERVSDSVQSASVYRLNGADFAIIIPNILVKEVEAFAAKLSGRFAELQQVFDSNSIAYTGIVAYESNDSVADLLALADTGINIAQTKTANAFHIQSDKSVLNNVSAKYGSQNWREVIEDVLNNKRVILFYQPIQPTNKNSKVYSEILARFSNKDGQVLPTHSFVAMAEKMGQIISIDRLIIECTMNLIQQKNIVSQSFAINITAKSAHDEQFLVWLERRLLREPAIASKLIFEITEFGINQNTVASKRFIQMLHRCGARLTVERFGIGFTSLKLFREIKPDYVKLDGSFSRNIDEDKNNQYFVRVLIDLAHRIGVSVIAESVETEVEKHTLEKIFIDGTQGYFIGKPTEL